MAKIQSDDYHDFVIKDGKLIGEFDLMYQCSKQTPWHQDQQENWLDIRVILDLLWEYGPFNYICDFGSGLGYLLDILKRNVGTPECKLTGYDVSPTCCKKAKEQFLNIDFHVLDLMRDIPHIHKERRKKDNRLFVIRGTLWYVFPNMENVVRNIASKTTDGDLLLVSQNFPPLDSNFVGKDIIPTPDKILGFFGSFFSPLKTIWIEDKLSDGNDNWFIATMRRWQEYE